MELKRILIMAFSFLLICSCRKKIKPENRVLTIAKKSDEPVAAKNGAHKIKYYWQHKLYRDNTSFDARYSKQYDYFMIYVDKTDPYNWISYSREDYGYSDTLYIPDSLRQKLFIDSGDFKLLEQEH